MPDKCCVPKCNSNYDSTVEYVTVFSFPKEKDRIDLWLRKIPRENLTVTKHTRICIKHFEERFIKRIFEWRGKDGVVHTEPRPKPILTSDAYPTQFPDLPDYLSDNSAVGIASV